MIMNRIFRRLIHRIVHLHNSGLISAPVAIIWRRKYRHHRPIVLPLVSFHDELMRARNKVQAIDVRKLLRDVLTKGVAGPPW